MAVTVGIRREDKNIWERRVPLTPDDVEQLIKEHGLKFIVQPFELRAFADHEFREAGAELDHDLSDCEFLFAIKEIPAILLMPKKNYIFFSHIIKGQPFNMPMLQRLIDLKSTLIDYECMKDGEGKRLVFFGRFAGLAGMIDTMYTLGRRLYLMGLRTPFEKVMQAYKYDSLAEAVEQIQSIAEEIENDGLPESLLPFAFGFAGYGNVSKGAQEIFDLLPHLTVSPDELANINKPERNRLYKVVFEEKDMVEPINDSYAFALPDYYAHPQKYRSKFHRYLPELTVLLNGIYWEERYPRLVTKQFLKNKYQSGDAVRLQVIGDISCDVNGSIECTEKVTDPDNPAYVYNPLTGRIKDGFDGPGVAIVALDNLPAEFPRDASIEFSRSLKPFVPAIVRADLKLPFDACDLPPEIKKAVIVYKGELTPDYQYLLKHLKKYHGEEK